MGNGSQFFICTAKTSWLDKNTSFSDKLLKAWMSLRRLNPLDLNRANVRKKFALLILAKSPKYNARRITEKKKKILREKKSVHTKKKPKFLRPTSIFLCTKLRSCFFKMTYP